MLRTSPPTTAPDGPSVDHAGVDHRGHVELELEPLAVLSELSWRRVLGMPGSNDRIMPANQLVVLLLHHDGSQQN